MKFASRHALWRIPVLLITLLGAFLYLSHRSAPDKVNYNALARITTGLAGAVKTLSGTN
jgi:hypothetical protein